MIKKNFQINRNSLSELKFFLCELSYTIIVQEDCVKKKQRVCFAERLGSESIKVISNGSRDFKGIVSESSKIYKFWSQSTLMRGISVQGRKQIEWYGQLSEKWRKGCFISLEGLN